MSTTSRISLQYSEKHSFLLRNRKPLLYATMSFSILKWVDIQDGQQASLQETKCDAQILSAGRIPAVW